MTDPVPPRQVANGDAAGGPARWQKVVGIVGLAVVAVLVILLLTGDHGPGRHTPGGAVQQPTNVEEDAGHGPSQWNH